MRAHRNACEVEEDAIRLAKWIIDELGNKPVDYNRSYHELIEIARKAENIARWARTEAKWKAKRLGFLGDTASVEEKTVKVSIAAGSRLTVPLASSLEIIGGSQKNVSLEEEEIILILGRDRMPPSTTEYVFEDWVARVVGHIDDLCGFPVTVGVYHPHDAQHDKVQGGTDEQQQAVERAKLELWTEWIKERVE